MCRPGEYYDSETEEVLPVPQEAGKRVIPFVEEDGVTKGVIISKRVKMGN